MPEFKKTYNLVGVKIRVLANHGYFIKFCDDYLGSIPGHIKIPGSINITLGYRLGRMPSRSLKGGKKKIYSDNSIIDIRDKTICSYYPALPPYRRSGFLIIPIWKLLMRLGCCPMHGALVKSGDKLIAFFGPSQSGKSTLSLAAMAHGFSLLCDDHFFVKDSGKTLRIFPFAKKIKLKNPHKKPSLDPNKTEISLKKSYFRSKSLIIVFPRYSPKKKISLRPVSKKDALLKLIKDNLWFKSGQTGNIRKRKEKADSIFQVWEKSTFYELGYNDTNLAKGGLKILQSIIQ
jgi:hypothetical protein